MNPAITSCTITGPGLKSRPMASYCAPAQQARNRAKREQADQRWQRERAEALHLMTQNGFEPFPPAPEMPAKLALHQEQQPDPQFSPDYLSLLIVFAMGATTGALFWAGRP